MRSPTVHGGPAGARRCGKVCADAGRCRHGPRLGAAGPARPRAAGRDRAAGRAGDRVRPAPRRGDHARAAARSPAAAARCGAPATAAAAPRDAQRPASARLSSGRAAAARAALALGPDDSRAGSSSPTLGSAGTRPALLAADLAENAIRSSRAISRSPSSRAGSSGGRPRDQLADPVAQLQREVRRRGAHELAHVVHRDPMIRRAGARAARLRPWRQSTSRAAVHGLDLEQRVDARLHVDRDGVLVADHPAVVVDAAHGVLVVAGLDVEQVVLQRRGQRVRRRSASSSGP